MTEPWFISWKFVLISPGFMDKLVIITKTKSNTIKDIVNNVFVLRFIFNFDVFFFY